MLFQRGLHVLSSVFITFFLYLLKYQLLGLAFPNLHFTSVTLLQSTLILFTWFLFFPSLNILPSLVLNNLCIILFKFLFISCPSSPPPPGTPRKQASGARCYWSSSLEYVYCLNYCMVQDDTQCRVNQWIRSSFICNRHCGSNNERYFLSLVLTP